MVLESGALWRQAFQVGFPSTAIWNVRWGQDLMEGEEANGSVNANVKSVKGNESDYVSLLHHGSVHDARYALPNENGRGDLQNGCGHGAPHLDVRYIRHDDLPNANESANDRDCDHWQEENESENAHDHGHRDGVTLPFHGRNESELRGASASVHEQHHENGRNVHQTMNVSVHVSVSAHPA